MEELIEKISEELQIDKSSWVLTKFGDVAIQQKQSVDRENTDLTRYVKGEHMGSEDLHLRSWGELKDEYLGPAFIRRFDQGDILYGSRRTYLRKVVIAPFSGITSNTTFVIKANEDNIDKRLLPFIMMSEGFTENSIRNSKGSVNPYINWKDIAKYEFLLPPKDQQAQLAKLLWAMDEVIEREKTLLENFKILKETKTLKLLASGEYEMMTVDDFLLDKKGAMKMGPFGSSLKREYFINEGVKYKVYGQENVFRKDMEEGDRFIDQQRFDKLKSCEIYPGDFLITVMGTIGKTMIVPEKIEQGIMDSHLIRLQIDKSVVSPLIIGLQFRLSPILNQIRRLAVGGIMDGLSSGTIKKLKFMIPKRSTQDNIVEVVEKLENNEIILIDKIKKSKSLQKSLINKIF